MPLPENWTDIYKSVTNFKTEPPPTFEVVFNEKENDKMPDSKIIKPDFKMDLSLWTRIMPSFLVGERVVCLNGIEHIGYEQPETDYNPLLDENLSFDQKAELLQMQQGLLQLAITYSSGNIEFFDQDEERELEEQIKAGIEKSEKIMTENQMLAAENQALKQELARVMAGKIQMPNFTGKRH